MNPWIKFATEFHEEQKKKNPDISYKESLKLAAEYKGGKSSDKKKTMKKGGKVSDLSPAPVELETGSGSGSSETATLPSVNAFKGGKKNKKRRSTKSKKNKSKRSKK